MANGLFEIYYPDSRSERLGIKAGTRANFQQSRFDFNQEIPIFFDQRRTWYAHAAPVSKP